MQEYEDRLRIATPEGVQLELTLAGLGSRFMAGLIDLILKLLLVGLFFLLLRGIGDLGIAVLIPAIALILFAYDVLWEVLGQGRTPGKRWNGLRVVRGDGAPVDLRASLVRNLLRLIDGWPLSYLPTMVLVVVTRRNQRLGDVAADTVVVRERRERDVIEARRQFANRPAIPPSNAGWERPEPPAPAAPEWDVSAVTAEDLVAVRSFLERRDELEAHVRVRIAEQLATALAPRVGGADASSAERFLEGVAAAKLARDRVS